MKNMFELQENFVTGEPCFPELPLGTSCPGIIFSFLNLSIGEYICSKMNLYNIQVRNPTVCHKMGKKLSAETIIHVNVGSENLKPEMP